VSLDYCGRQVTFPSQPREAVPLALNNSRFVVRNLPGDLHDAGKLTPVRRLIQEGFVVAAAK
jgi:hypothetical protein